MLTILAPAKINWFLEILGKRPDGFHAIETVMQAISLFDEIRVEDSDQLRLECDVNLGPPEQNLAFRAARLLQKHAPGRGALIRLSKRIPHGAGLGGGSSDAACTLVALNRLWGLGFEAERLRVLAAEIGSDCAFFVQGGLARCTGRGEVIHPLPDLPAMNLVILYPNVACPTGPVYAHAGRSLTGESLNCYFAHTLTEVIDSAKLAATVFNRLQDSALQVCSGLREAWDATEAETGVMARFVSGSGSSIAFLMQDGAVAGALAESLKQRGLGQSFAVQTLPRGVTWGNADARDRGNGSAREAGV